MYKRIIEQILVDLLADFRIVYLTGPWQTGKTTLAKRIADQLGMKYVTLDDQAVLATVRKSDFKGLTKLADYAGQHFDQGVLLNTGNEVLPFKLQGREFHAVPLSILV